MAIPLHVLAQVTATRCCVCRAALTDAESVSLGLGPHCSKKYYAPDHQPTQDQVQTALGLLASSELADHLIEAFLSVVNNDHANARKGCNLLVYWASAHYDNREEVFKCTAVIRALGYTTLAEKLETDRTEGVILDKGTHLEVFLRPQKKLDQELKRIPGVKPLVEIEKDILGQYTTTRIKRGSKVGWQIPKEAEEHLECVLGVTLAGKLVCGTKGVRVIVSRRWSELLSFYPPRPTTATPFPKELQIRLPLRRVILAADPLFVIDSQDGKLRVITPYDTTFIARLKNQIPWADRKWEAADHWWAVSKQYQSVVLQLISECFKQRGTTSSGSSL